MAATVLVVEDERKLRDFIRSYLERAGFTVLSTGSGAEAISMATAAAPDLVVLDLGLPDGPGETVARELRTMSAGPLWMLTAKAASFNPCAFSSTSTQRSEGEGGPMSEDLPNVRHGESW